MGGGGLINFIPLKRKGLLKGGGLFGRGGGGFNRGFTVDNVISLDLFL